jgi:hypothetical protein
MLKDEIIAGVLTPALRRAHAEMPNFNLNQLSEHDALYGVPGSILDSLNLITFVFIIEDEFERYTGKKLKITTQDVLRSVNPPFKSLQALSDFLVSKTE